MNIQQLRAENVTRKQLRAAASPGPWYVQSCPAGSYDLIVMTECVRKSNRCIGRVGRLNSLEKTHEPKDDDVALWVAARNDNTPALLDECFNEIERLRGLLADVHVAMKKYEMDVDCEPPCQHRQLMQRVRDQLYPTDK